MYLLIVPVQRASNSTPHNTNPPQDEFHYISSSIPMVDEGILRHYVEDFTYRPHRWYLRFVGTLSDLTTCSESWNSQTFSVVEEVRFRPYAPTIDCDHSVIVSPFLNVSGTCPRRVSIKVSRSVEGGRI